MSEKKGFFARLRQGMSKSRETDRRGDGGCTAGGCTH